MEQYILTVIVVYQNVNFKDILQNQPLGILTQENSYVANFCTL